MPTYDYECNDCHHRFEQWQSFNDAKLTDCPACGKPALHRLFGSGAAIVFKGSGFYETDYRRPDAERKQKAAGGKVESDTPESKPAEAKPTESTPAAKGDAPASPPPPPAPAKSPA